MHASVFNPHRIVVVIRGNSISQSSITNLLRILYESSDDLGIPVEGFSQGCLATLPLLLLIARSFFYLAVDVDYVKEEDVLSTQAIVGIAVSSVVAVFAIVVAWIVIITCCCVHSKRKIAPSKVPQGER